MDLTSKLSRETRKASLDLVKDNPKHLLKYFSKNHSIDDYLFMPKRHRLSSIDIGKQGMKVLQRAYELQPSTYEELLCIRGMGAKKIRALALLSKLLFGTEIDWRDPAKYSFAHGGKDGYPYPVDIETYENTIMILREAVEQAKLDKKEKLNAIKRLEKLI